MFIEDGFDYHIKIAVKDWVQEHDFDDSDHAIADLDGSRPIRAALARALLGRAEFYRDLNEIIRSVMETTKD